MNKETTPKKVDMTNLFVYLGMGLLLLIIALPPILRSFAPKGETGSGVVIPEDKVEALICNQVQETDHYTLKISTRTNYTNDALTQVKLIYTQQPKGTSEFLPLDEATMELMTKLQSVEGITYSNDSGVTSFGITKNIFDNNLTEPLLANYNQPLAEQKNYYEGLGMTCSVLS